jgi:hypothetical protein
VSRSGASGERPSRRSERGRRVAAKAERDGERRIRANAGDLAALDNIAVAGLVETADEAHVLVQFGIAVARHRRIAVVTRNKAVRTSELERRNDRRGRNKQGRVPLAMSAEFVPSHPALLFAPPPATLGFASR